ncbi:hypothetical protein NX059_002878 [Plenodomus lindquistii]|nr:hypothetical protein NX059_002878 [Plenodomus lindquistii]
MAHAIGPSGRGRFGQPASYETPFPCSHEAYGPYQEWPFRGFADQQRNSYAHLPGNRQSSFGGMGNRDFFGFAQSNPYARSSGYQDFGTHMGMPSSSGMSYVGRDPKFSQPPFIGPQLPRGLRNGSTFGRAHIASYPNCCCGLAARGGRHAPSRFFDVDNDSDDSEGEGFGSYPRYTPQRPRGGALPRNHQRSPYGMRSVPRQYGRYDVFDEFDDDEVEDQDDHHDDYFTHPSRRCQRSY